MENFNGTPGPWLVGSRHGNLKTEIVRADGGQAICTVWTHDLAPNAEMRASPSTVEVAEGIANAALIAAAPETLEALALVLPLAKAWAASHPVGNNAAFIAQAEAAIAKATGAQ